MKLFFDIETIPYGDINTIKVEAPGNYKNPDAIAKYQAEHREEEYRKRALRGHTGQIVSIAWAFDDQPATGYTRGEDDVEADVLEEFFLALMTYRDKLGLKDAIHWVGHNVIDFDMRYLWQRCVVNNIRPPVQIPCDTRHGYAAFDTMKEWCGAYGQSKYIKLDELYEVLGGDTGGLIDMDGSKVYDLWIEGDIDTILAYNIQDVNKTRYVYKRMAFK